MKLTIEKQKSEMLIDLPLWILKGELDHLIKAINNNILSIDEKIIRSDSYIPILSEACEHGQLEIVKFLLEKGANIYLLDSDKNAALYWAMFYASSNKTDQAKVDIGFKIVDALLEHELKIRKENPQKYREQEFLYNILDKDQKLPIAFLNRTAHANRAHELINKYRIRRNNAVTVNSAMNFLAKTGRNLMLQIFLDNCSEEEFYAVDQHGQNLLHKAIMGFMQNDYEDNPQAKENFIHTFMHIFSEAKSLLEGKKLEESLLLLAEDINGREPANIPNQRYLNVLTPIEIAKQTVKKGKASLYLLQKVKEVGAREDDPKAYHTEKLRTLREVDVYGDNTMHFICHFIQGRINEGDDEWVKVGLEMLREVLNYEALIYVNHPDIIKEASIINAKNKDGKTPIELISDENIRKQIEEIKKLPEVNVLNILANLPNLMKDGIKQKNIKKMFVDHLYDEPYHYEASVKTDYLAFLEEVMKRYEQTPDKEITEHEIFKLLGEAVNRCPNSTKKDNAVSVLINIGNEAKKQNRNSPLYHAFESFKKKYDQDQAHSNRKKDDGEHSSLINQRRTNQQNYESNCLIM